MLFTVNFRGNVPTLPLWGRTVPREKRAEANYHRIIHTFDYETDPGGASAFGPDWLA
jgi:hypothetical protein